eukprot:NODE_6294_length_519_cov_7.697872_g5526_i0.p1 GENE.NODE_6294_length_519_cov_7.697872_g5526_i0~~NODE_6294_length_519_cov_7.697872_g5526_i0.p1  ORF type:complete len:149 (+),score=27.84 NODE_6294_length_519_cov_7.697872_g5526_i0:38-448(+)
MLSCAGADRLQTGMRGAFGKPVGTAARVHIGQVLISVRGRDTHKQHMMEALRRAKMKFPGRQVVVQSTKWGFTQVTRYEYEPLKYIGMVRPDGVSVQIRNKKGAITKKNCLMQHQIDEAKRIAAEQHVKDLEAGGT